jgi:hypothetical protein
LIADNANMLVATAYAGAQLKFGNTHFFVDAFDTVPLDSAT